jgi:hypothetical protein
VKRWVFDAAMAIEEGAKFIASWGTDVAAGEAAVQYGIASAEMFQVAGKSGRSARRGGGSYGGSAYRSDAGGGGGDRAWNNPQTLAPGAGGGGGRFGSPGSGVVIIRGTQEFENYVARAVNGAVARGVNVTATSSQRGAPVGH